MSLSIETKLPPDEEGERFVNVSRQGKLHRIDTQEKKKDTQGYSPKKHVILLLFTRKNPKRGQKIIFKDRASIGASNFDKSKPTKILVHGWVGIVASSLNVGTSMASSPCNVVVKDAFLAALDVNVFVFDWGAGASGSYWDAWWNVESSGRFLAEVVDWLGDIGLALTMVHLVGYSLGAHVAGTAGRSIKRGKVPYLTGLDPAMLGWFPWTGRICSLDADYVEIIHTSTLGLKLPLGHADFYPNGGWVQPGCSAIDLGPSHSRSFELFACSLDNRRFMARECSSYTEVIAEMYARNAISLHMGGSEPKLSRGIFHLLTSDREPYYLN